jgi:probable HAF family extracellular repeat protein
LTNQYGRGQIVGESYINDTPSPYCGDNLGFPLKTGAFLWEHGTMKNLGSFGGTCTFATDLNDRGEVVGIFTLGVGDTIQHAFLWKNGSLTNLPNTIGGKNAAAIALNNSGDVVGWASAPGDQDINHEQIHASLWRDNTMTDIGTVDVDPCSLAFSINAIGQVVGISLPACDFSQGTRAFLFEAGSIVDLNSLIPSDSSLYLTAPETINNRGVIAGVGLDSNGNQHAFVLIPCSSNDAACQNAPAETGASRVSPPPYIHEPPAAGQDNPIRQLLRGRLGFSRFAAIPKNLTSNTTLTSGPNVTLAPTSLAFGTVAIGTTSPAKTVTLTNVGTTTLTINGIAITGTNAGDFAQTPPVEVH